MLIPALFIPRPHRPPRRPYLPALFFAMVVVAGALFLPPPAQAAEAPERRFYRAALVLQRLAPEQPWEAVSIPSGMKWEDRTSALLHHSDRLFVISSLAREMDTLSAEFPIDFPAAPHYAALAYHMAGNTRDAARCMARYMENAPFSAANALFLVRRLYENGEYTAMRLAAARWQKEEHGCDTRRLAYVWGSWIAQSNMQEARYAVKASQCSGWYPDLLYLRARSLAGEDVEADLAQTGALYPDNAHEIQALWTEFGARARYP